MRLRNDVVDSKFTSVRVGHSLNPHGVPPLPKPKLGVRLTGSISRATRRGVRGNLIDMKKRMKEIRKNDHFLHSDTALTRDNDRTNNTRVQRSRPEDDQFRREMSEREKVCHERDIVDTINDV